ncbi:protein Mdm4-like [Pieris rapae]|uniref:protein Mdm4-like n=1 Tax=Pieris rapae TaxID=64459 RepID=UPI001E27AB82|nr:protein Mdm4-like [Pieris rapae]
MNISASYSSEPSWSRRCSTETIFSIQGKETDFVRDTSDTDFVSDGEYEPITDTEDDGLNSGNSSCQSDDDIITTKVLEVSVGDDGELQLADSEQTLTDDDDSEIDLHDYWLCAQCQTKNNNPRYRYCEKCFKVRRDFFPPRPKQKHRRKNRLETDILRPQSSNSDINAKNLPDSQAKSLTLSKVDPTNVPEPFPSSLQDSGVESAINSQDLSQDVQIDNFNAILDRNLKRRAASADRNIKRFKDSRGFGSLVDDDDVKPLNKTTSDPEVKIDSMNAPQELRPSTNMAVASSDINDMCITCYSAPKSGVFVHGRIAHICCCFKCAVKVWNNAKRCPVCNCKVSNVLKAVVM